MSVDATKNEMEPSKDDEGEPSKEVEVERKKKEGKFLIYNVIALTILITSSTLITFDYIQNIHLLKHSKTEEIQFYVNLLLYVTGSVSPLFALLSDCAFQDFQVELAEAVLSTCGSIVAAVVNYFFPFSRKTILSSLFSFLLQMVTTPNTWAFLLHQTRYVNGDVDWVLSLTLLGTYLVCSVFLIISELIRLFAEVEYLSHFFTIWQVLSSLSRIVILLILSTHVHKPDISFGPLATVALVSFHNVRIFFRRICQKSANSKKFQDVDVFYTKRFWAVVSILLFLIPFGFGSMCTFVVSKYIQIFLLKKRTSLLENFHGHYFIGGSILTFFYFFGLAPLLKKKKFWTKELKHLGIAFVLLAIALSYLGILQTVVFRLGFRMKEDYAHLRLLNLLDSAVKIRMDLLNTSILPYTMMSLSEKASKQHEWYIEVQNDEHGIMEKTSLIAYKDKTNVYAINDKNGIERLEIDFDLNIESRGEPPLLFHLPMSANVTLNFKSQEENVTLEPKATKNLPRDGYYEIEALKSEPITLEGHHFEHDSISAFLLVEPITKESLKIFSLKQPSSVDINWLLPCGALLALADAVKLYACLKFVFFQGPPHLRTLAISIAYFMIATTNFIYLLPLGLENFDLYVFIVLTIVVIFFAFYVYYAMKFTPYVFTTHGKL